MKRKRLLGMARHLSPIDTVGRLGLINRTVLPRILRHGTCWAVMLVYLLACVLSRTGYLAFTDFDTIATTEGLAQPGRVITFMIIFYVSYCYNRYITQFGDVEVVMRSIVNACTLARVLFTNGSPRIKAKIESTETRGGGGGAHDSTQHEHDAPPACCTWTWSPLRASCA